MKSLISNFESLGEKEISKHSGEWISVCEGKIISHGKDLKKVLDESKDKCMGKRPLIGKLPEAIPSVLNIH